jgi:hypothetical protein
MAATGAAARDAQLLTAFMVSWIRCHTIHCTIRLICPCISPFLQALVKQEERTLGQSRFAACAAQPFCLCMCLHGIKQQPTHHALTCACSRSLPT